MCLWKISQISPVHILSGCLTTVYIVSWWNPFLNQSVCEVVSVAADDEIVVKMKCCSKDLYHMMGLKPQTDFCVVDIHKAQALAEAVY